MGEHGVLRVHALRHLDDRLRFTSHEGGLVVVAGDHPISYLETGHPRPDPADGADVAVTHPARIAGRSRNLLSPFVVAPVRADLQRRDLRFHPDFIRRQITRVQFPLLDVQIPRSAEDGYLHVRAPDRVIASMVEVG